VCACTLWTSCLFQNVKIKFKSTIKFCERRIDLVVHNSVQSSFGHNAFQSLKSETARKFLISMDKNNTRSEEEKKRKSALGKELGGNFVELKMDARTRIQVNFIFSIKVRRFVEDGKVKTKTLSATI